MYFAYIKLGSGEGFQGSNPHRSSAYPQSPLGWVPGYNTVSLTCSLVFCLFFVFALCFFWRGFYYSTESMQTLIIFKLRLLIDYLKIIQLQVKYYS